MSYGFIAYSFQTGKLYIRVGGMNEKGKLGYHVEYRKENEIVIIEEGKKSQDDLWRIHSQMTVGV